MQLLTTPTNTSWRGIDRPTARPGAPSMVKEDSYWWIQILRLCFKRRSKLMWLLWTDEASIELVDSHYQGSVSTTFGSFLRDSWEDIGESSPRISNVNIKINNSRNFHISYTQTINTQHVQTC